MPKSILFTDALLSLAFVRLILFAINLGNLLKLSDQDDVLAEFMVHTCASDLTFSTLLRPPTGSYQQTDIQHIH